MDPDELARECARTIYAGDEAARHLGIELVDIKVGQVELKMEVKPWMVNGAAVCHGGLLFSLADTAMAYASNSRNDVHVALSASIEFLAAGKIGETITAIAREVHRSGKTATYEVALCDSRGERIGQFLGRTYRLKGNVIDT